MSGHSKWANIKRRKEAQDQKRGKVFSKLARLIAVAVREGGSPDPAANPKLRLVIERARAENMPKENIQRAIENAIKDKEAIEELILEGYGPGGVGILVEAVTDNRQRTIQEIKNIFQKNGGSLSEPGAVAFQFEKKGVIEIEDPGDEEKILSLIDLGVEDFETDDQIVILWLAPSNLEELKKKIETAGLVVKRVDLVMRPKNFLRISDPAKARAALALLETLEQHDDVQRVFTNLDIPDELLN